MSSLGHSPRLVGEPEDFLELLDDFVTRSRVRGPIVHDARVAAICVGHGIEALLIRDRDFSLFPELRRQHSGHPPPVLWRSPVALHATMRHIASAGVTSVPSTTPFTCTLALFTYEYSVPVLSPEVAAYLGTFTELFFPVLLVLGLAGRLAAVVLFLFNIIAVLSYPGLMAVGIEQHQIWGLMLLVTLSHGPGKLSLDHWIGKRYFGS